MKRLMAGTLAAAASLAITASAHAAPKTFWFDCAGPAPLQTLVSDDPTWSETPPSGSVQDGSGCGWLDPGALQGSNQPNPLYDAAFGGTYKGEIDKAVITLYGPDVPNVSEKTIDLQVLVDGEQAYTGTLTPAVGAGPAQGIDSFTFTIPAAAIDVAASHGEKSIQLAVSQTYADGGTPGWFLGASEVPSNVKFFSYADLTPEEQAEVDCARDETLCDTGE